MNTVKPRNDPAPPAAPAAQDAARLAQAVDELTAVLTQTGMPRMAARVFAYALAEDSDRYTAADFAEGLQISPAAVSGSSSTTRTFRLVISFTSCLRSNVRAKQLPLPERAGRPAARSPS